MAPSNLPDVFNATSQDIEMLLSAACHLGSKNLQTHMESYVYKTRIDGVNVINVGKTWLVRLIFCERVGAVAAARQFREIEKRRLGGKWKANKPPGRRLFSLRASSPLSTTRLTFALSPPVPTASALS